MKMFCSFQLATTTSENSPPAAAIEPTKRMAIAPRKNLPASGAQVDTRRQVTTFRRALCIWLKKQQR